MRRIYFYFSRIIAKHFFNFFHRDKKNLAFYNVFSRRFTSRQIIWKKVYWHSFTWRPIPCYKKSYTYAVTCIPQCNTYTQVDRRFLYPRWGFLDSNSFPLPLCFMCLQATIYRSFEWHYGVSVKPDERYCRRKKAGWHYLRFICNRSLKVGLIILRFLPLGWTFRPRGY